MHSPDPSSFSPTVAGGTGPTIVTQNIHNYAAPGFGATILPPAPPSPPPAGTPPAGPMDDGKNHRQTSILLWTFALVCVVLFAVLLQALILKPQPSVSPLPLPPAPSPSPLPEPATPQPALPGRPPEAAPSSKPEPQPMSAPGSHGSGDIIIHKTDGTTIINQNGTIIMPAPQPGPVIRPVPPVAPPQDLTIHFDRPDVTYHQGDKQGATIQVPSAGYLYVASVWAAVNGTYSLFHPAWSAGLEQVDKAGASGPTTYRLNHRRYAQALQAGIIGQPHRFEAGDILLLPDTELNFPNLPDPSVDVAFEHVLVILSEELLPGITSFYGKGKHGEGNIEPALTHLGLLESGQIKRTRGGLPPDLIKMQSLPRFKHATAVYEMRRSPRK